MPATTGLLVLCLGALPSAALGQVSNAPADEWITNGFQLPQKFTAHPPLTNGFETLHAEAIAGRLKIFWPLNQPETNAVVALHVSVDEAGHWPARDWRTVPMELHRGNWEVAVPVMDLDLPLIYFVSAQDARTLTVSAMRRCLPRAVGLEEPTRLFWPFLEGFEEGWESWQLLTPEAAPLKTDATAHTGRVALAVSLPAGKNSVTIATTRLRGWHYWKQNATGVRVWLRTRTGTGRGRFTLLANAFSANQVVSLYPKEVTLSDHWQKVNLPFSSFPKVPFTAVDLLTIEFIGKGPQEFLVDDLQLLGPWRMEFE